MFFVYQLLLFLILLISPLIILIRIFKKKEHKLRFFEKFGINSIFRKKGKLIWFHGSSVGEIMSLIPVIRYYEADKSINQILITSSTLSSANILKKYRFKKTVHQFFPIDFFLISRNFLNYWRPAIAIFVESEIWPCMFYNLDKKKIPLVLLNARLTNKTFGRWLLLKEYANHIFNKISYCYPQNLETLRYLKKLKTKKIKFIGNLKFIENPYDRIINSKEKLNLFFSKHKIWVAASTHHNEEAICAKAHIILKKRIKNLITIIIPRHINRTQEIISKITKLNLKVATHSSSNKNLKNTDIYLVDTYGDSKKFYEIANTVFLGGSLTNRGGQNPLEAARYGAKILHGTNVKNFEDVYKFLRKVKLSHVVKNALQISKKISFRNSKKKKNKINKIGREILNKTTNELNILIKNAN